MRRLKSAAMGRSQRSDWPGLRAERADWARALSAARMRRGFGRGDRGPCEGSGLARRRHVLRGGRPLRRQEVGALAQRPAHGARAPRLRQPVRPGGAAVGPGQGGKSAGRPPPVGTRDPRPRPENPRPHPGSPSAPRKPASAPRVPVSAQGPRPHPPAGPDPPRSPRPPQPDPLSAPAPLRRPLPPSGSPRGRPLAPALRPRGVPGSGPWASAFSQVPALGAPGAPHPTRPSLCPWHGPPPGLGPPGGRVSPTTWMSGCAGPREPGTPTLGSGGSGTCPERGGWRGR